MTEKHKKKAKRLSRTRLQTRYRLQLITAFGGNVPLAETALKFVNGHPEASEQYRCFKEWEKEKYMEYCKAKGIRLVETTSKAER